MKERKSSLMNVMLSSISQRIDCLHSAFSFKIRLVLISVSATGPGGAVTSQRKIRDCSQSSQRRQRIVSLWSKKVRGVKKTRKFLNFQ